MFFCFIKMHSARQVDRIQDSNIYMLKICNVRFIIHSYKTFVVTSLNSSSCFSSTAALQLLSKDTTTVTISINIMNILLAKDEILNTCKYPYRRRKQNGTGPKLFGKT